MPHPFLSDEWIEAARAIRADVDDDRPREGLPEMRVNVVVTEVPFGEGVVHAHVETAAGTLDIEVGHLDDPQVTVTVDHGTARAIFVEGETQAVMAAVFAGKITIDGDLATLLVLVGSTQAPSGSPEAEAAAARLREITA